MSESSKLSVVIPAYNAEQTIGRTLDSVRPLINAGAECIVINDGSTDLTQQVVQRVRAQGLAISLVSQSNGGLSRARNAGFRRSTRQWVTFVDADDLLEPAGILKAVKSAQQSGLRIAKSRIVTCSAENLDGSPEDLATGDASQIDEYVTRSLDSWLLRGWGGLLGAVFHRDLLEEMDPPFVEVPFGEDLVFTYALSTLEREYADSRFVGYRYITGQSIQMTSPSNPLRLQIGKAFRACEAIAKGKSLSDRALLWTLVARYRLSRSRQVDPQIRPEYKRAIKSSFSGLHRRLGLSVPQIIAYLTSLPGRI